MAYEIWSTAPGNLLATYDTKAEAVAAVHAAMQTHGREYVLDLALAYENSRGYTRTIAAGESLVQLVDRATAASVPSRVRRSASTTAGRRSTSVAAQCDPAPSEIGS